MLVTGGRVYEACIGSIDIHGIRKFSAIRVYTNGTIENYFGLVVYPKVVSVREGSGIKRSLVGIELIQELTLSSG
jgi:hypothetical protein